MLAISESNRSLAGSGVVIRLEPGLDKGQVSPGGGVQCGHVNIPYDVEGYAGTVFMLEAENSEPLSLHENEAPFRLLPEDNVEIQLDFCFVVVRIFECVDESILAGAIDDLINLGVHPNTSLFLFSYTSMYEC